MPPLATKWNPLALQVLPCQPTRSSNDRDAPVVALVRRVHVELLHHVGSQSGVAVKELPGVVNQLAAREPLQCTDHLLTRAPESLHCAQTEVVELSVLGGNLRPQPHHESGSETDCDYTGSSGQTSKSSSSRAENGVPSVNVPVTAPESA
jgi:hypothetical protein